MKTLLKILCGSTALFFLVLVILFFFEGEITLSILFLIIGSILVYGFYDIFITNKYKYFLALRKLIKSFPKVEQIGYSDMDFLLENKVNWEKSKLFKNIAIKGYDLKINDQNVNELGENYLNFFITLFPGEENIIQDKINKNLLNIANAQIIEEDRINQNLLKEFVDSKKDGNKLNPKYIEEIVAKSNELGIEKYNSFLKAKNAFSYEILIWELDNGIFPDLVPDFILHKDEKCIYKNSFCELLERKEITKRVNYAGPRLRIKIAKGLSYNLGSYNVGIDKKTITVSKGIGTLNLTTKRILFKNSDNIMTVQFSSIIDTEPFTDAVIISKSTGKPMIFSINDGLYFYLLLNFAINKN